MMNFDKQINSILGKKIKHPNLLAKKTKKDWDGDGIPNVKDCQPRNIMRQDSLNKTKFQLGDRVKVKLSDVVRGPVSHTHSKYKKPHTHKKWLYPEGVGRIISISRTKPIQYTVELEKPFYNTHGYIIKIVSGFEHEIKKV